MKTGKVVVSEPHPRKRRQMPCTDAIRFAIRQKAQSLTNYRQLRLLHQICLTRDISLMYP